MKYLFTLLLVVAFSTPAFADFDKGQNKNGLYCLTETCETVFSTDASLLLNESDAGQGNKSSAWYMRKLINSKLNKPTEKFWERIEKMKRLR